MRYTLDNELLTRLKNAQYNKNKHILAGESPQSIPTKTPTYFALCPTKSPFTRYRIRAWFDHMKLNGSTTSILTIVCGILQQVVTEKSSESKYDRKPPELDVVTNRIRYRVNGV